MEEVRVQIRPYRQSSYSQKAKEAQVPVERKTSILVWSSPFMTWVGGGNKTEMCAWELRRVSGEMK